MAQPCEHLEASCTEQCACTCDGCQEHYETQWAKNVAEQDLCSACGMPMEMTLERLQETYSYHFFQACDICRPAYLALMKQNKMCPSCQQYMQSDTCTDCFCTEQPYLCVCRQCKAYRKNLEGT